MTPSAATRAAPWIESIDDAVAEVFEMMLRQPCIMVDEASPAGQSISPSISAKIVFSGTLEGQCIVRLSTEAADRLTDALLGAEGDWDDSMIDDAVGEMCNMIAGGWKSKLEAHASACNLSVPAVSRSHACETPHPRTHETVPVAAPTARRFYAFDGSVLEVTLALAKQRSAFQRGIH